MFLYCTLSCTASRQKYVVPVWSPYLDKHIHAHEGYKEEFQDLSRLTLTQR